MKDHDELAAAQLAAREGRTLEAIAALKWLADGGNSVAASAAYTLGIIYEGGLGVSADQVSAKTYYELTSLRGCSLADYRLAGIFHRNGQLEEALRYFQASAHDNPSSSYWCFKLMSARGQDEGKARISETYLTRAEELGHILAKRERALREFKGRYGFINRCRGMYNLLKVTNEAKTAYAA